MNNGLEIVASQVQGRVPVTILYIKGQLDSSNYGKLHTAANDAFEEGMRYLILDFSETTFLTSAGLRAINVQYTHSRIKQVHSIH